MTNFGVTVERFNLPKDLWKRPTFFDKIVYFILRKIDQEVPLRMSRKVIGKLQTEEVQHEYRRNPSIYKPLPFFY